MSSVGAVEARLSVTGSGAVASIPTSSARLTVIRCGGSITGAGNRPCTISIANSARCSTTATASPARSSALMPVLSMDRRYDSSDERLLTAAGAALLVISEIRLSPARFNSPITAMTRP